MSSSEVPAQPGPAPDPSVATPTAAATPTTARIVKKKAAKPQFTSMMLILEAFVVFFATLVAVKLADVPPAQVWIAGGVLSLVLIVLSRMVSAPGGYIAGSAVQIPVIAIGFVIPLMFGVAAVFVSMWVVSLWLGAKIDRERADYDAAHPDQAPNVT